ncbi:discoidin domain-containing protein [Longispora fulva]|uniref:RHS repeat-associated protein n=1 Tax=Longispora fulva TaxID=619741 RepID=A0A8J7GRT5_9ACTN|nr:discoidin domain-containing protein [Longispora fulva]MBG6135811.1 RHS repeat-associated protein [Longispora fulva]
MTLGQTWSILPPAQAAPAKPPVPCPVDRPDEASAVLAAKLCKKTVKVSGSTTETDEIVANPDGTLTLQHHTRPVRVQRNGQWVPTDTTLRVAPDGSVVPGAVTLGVRFSGGGEGPLLTATVDGQELALGSPVGVLPKPVIAGDTATYPEVLRGVDLKVTAGVDGFSEVLVVKDRAAALDPKLRKLRFPTTTKGLTSRNAEGGRVELVDAKGRAVLTSSMAEMWDAAHERSREAAPKAAQRSAGAADAPAAPAGKRAVMEIKAVAGAFELTPDKALLADPDVTFPLTIDPSWTLGRHGWYLVDSGDAAASLNPNDYAKTGTWNGGTNKVRSFWNIDLAGQGMGTNRQILSAHFRINEVWAWSCSPRPVELHRVPWLVPSLNWANQPGSTWYVDQRNEAHGWSSGGIGGSSSCPAATVDWDVTSVLQDSQNRGDNTISFMLKAANESDNYYWKKFDPNIALDVNFNARPRVTALATTPTSQCATGSGRPWINTLTPTLSVTGGNDDGDNLKSYIQLWNAGGSMITQFETAFAAQGAWLSAKVPTGMLAEGGTYAWRAATDDGKTWSADGVNAGSWSQWCEFSVDTVKPGAPFVSSTDYPNDGQWNHGQYGKPGTFTFKPAGTGSPAPVTSATSSPACQAAESADKAVDGTVANNSKWCSVDASKWLQLKLSTEQMVTNVVIRHASAGGEPAAWNTKDYDIQTSMDGATWTTAVQVRGNTGAVTNDRLPAPTRAGYVKVVVVTPTQDGSAATRLYEVETYGLPVIPVTSATSSAVCQAAESADKAIDGTTAGGSKWCSADVSKWLQLKLAGTQTITNVVIRHSGDGGEQTAWNTKDYDILTSVDGSTWNTALQVRGNTQSVTDHALPAPTQAGYLKLVVITPTQNGDIASRIYEVQAYNAPTALASDTAAYTYQLDTDTAPKDVAAGGVTTAQVTPGEDGPRTLTVRAKDKAGNLSDPVVYRFNVGRAGLTQPAPGSNIVARAKLAVQGDSSYTRVVYQYRRGPGGLVYDVPVAHLRKANGDPVTALPVPLSDLGGNAIWNAVDTLGTVGGVVQMRAKLYGDINYVGDGSVRNPASGRCLNASGAGPWPNGTEIILWDCVSGSENERFELGADGLIRNPVSGRCLNAEGAGPWGNGTRLLLWDCVADAPNEKFERTADGMIRNPASGRCLNASGVGPWNNGTKIILWDCVAGSDNEKWSEIDTNYTTQWLTANIDANGDGAAGSGVGPGSVNLLTGDYSLSSTDTDEFGLKVSRASSSRSPEAGWVRQGERLTPNQQQVSTDLTGIESYTTTMARSTLRGQGSSSDSLELTPTWQNNGDTFASVGGDQYAMRLGMKAGKRYRMTGWIFVPGSSGLTPTNAGLGLRIVGVYKDAAGNYQNVVSGKAAWTDAWQELSVDMALPPGATEAFFRVFNGHAGGSGKKVYWDNLSVREVVAPFGPQWLGGATDGTADHIFSALEFPSPEVAQVTMVAGGNLTFARNSLGGFFPEPGSENLTLTKVSDTEYQLADLDGTVVQFAKQGEKFAVTSTWTSDANSTTRYLYDTSDNRDLLKRVINPQEPGTGDCTTPVPARGCEVLEYEYATATTAGAGALGDFTDRVRSVKIWNWDPVAGAVNAVDVTRYAYDDLGRLREVWDPRLATPLKTAYEYDTAGRVTKVTGAGELPHLFDFDGAGKLQKLRRGALKAGTRDQSDGENTTQVVYGVPTTRGAGGPYDLDWAAIQRWGQRDLPTDATAVFGPESDPGTSTASATAPGKDGYGLANVHYLNASGQEVNTATPGGHIDTQEYDVFGNVVRTLEATNRELALGTLPDADRSLGDLNLAGLDTASRANALSTVKTYSADGQDMLESVGPTVKIALESDLVDPAGTLTTLTAGSQVIARGRQTGTYDEGKPDGTTYHLATTETESAKVAGYPDADVRVSRQGYGAEKGGVSGWKVRKPTSVTTDAGTAYTVFDASARAVQSWGIGSDGTDARATRAVYYTAGTNAEDSRCSNRPEWSGRPCVTRAAGAVTGHDAARMTSDLPVKWVETYSRFGEPTVVSETAAGKTRRTTTGYDGADRITSVEITSDVGAAVPALTTEYDAQSGHVTKTTMGGTTVTREYDLLGRLITYTDADGGVTRSEFDHFGKPSKVSDNTGSSTFTYDRALEPRGLLTSVTDSVAGTFSARYSPDGQLTEMTYPGGVTRKDTLDSSLAPVARTYTRDSDSTVLYAESVVDNTQGHKVAHSYTGGSRTYGYDKVGRLTSVRQIDAVGSCVTRTYSYDARTNRTGQRAFRPAAGGGCQSDTADSEGAHTYDSADRLTDAGYRYDEFGRTTDLPGGLKNSYYANDLVAGQETPDTRQAWTLDPKHRFRGFTTTKLVGDTWSPASSKLNHYGDDSDEARWIVEDTTTGAVTRNVSGPDSDLVATTSATGNVKLSLTNLHGDVALTIDTALTSPEFHNYDEFGVPSAGQSDQRYGWLGGKQRSSEAQGGVVLMGVRLYQPTLGRFLQSDPVPGGSATAYDYCNADPVNCTDLAGTWSWKKVLGKVAVVASIAAIIPGPIGMAAAGVSAVCYAATGNWKMAAVMTAGIALSAVGAGAAVVAARAATIVRAARATETAVVAGMRAKGVSSFGAGLIGRGGRIHTIARGFTRPLERFGAKVDRTIRGTKLRPDWQFGRHIVEMKRGSEAGIAAGKAALARYRTALGQSGRNYLLTYPEKAGQWWKWRIRRIR